MIRTTGVLFVSTALMLAAAPSAGWAQVPEAPPTVGALDVAPPAPPASQYDALVTDRKMLVALGKALFWDGAVGSDGQACASCHFHAGADPRITNQLSPGLKVEPLADIAFGGIAPAGAAGLTRGGFLESSGNLARPNTKLEGRDFPFHQLADITDRNADILYDSNDVASSQGVFDGLLIGVDEVLSTRNGKRDLCSPILDATTIFKLDVNGPRRTRKVEPRNTPTVINAAYFYRNFWDGRANNVFNGKDVFGRRDVENNPNARIVRNQGGSFVLDTLLLENMSLASQAVGPPNSSFEMACANRSFAYIGKKLLGRQALATQKVHPQDSVFGPMGLVGPLRGLSATYEQMIQQAFARDLWDGTGQFNISGGQIVPAPSGGFRQIENNFSLFWGLAIDAYERTLISDQTPFDAYMRGKRRAMTAQQIAGLAVFNVKGKCVNCHTGPVFSGAAVPPRQQDELIELMVMGDGAQANYDGGFYNIGVRPTFEDIGLGGEDPYGIPLSFTRQFKRGTTNGDSFDRSSFSQHQRVAVDGAFKVPTLRNVALTAPYFHNGGQATLRQVVEFYNRGGDRRGPNGDDTTGTGDNGEGRPVKSGMGGSNLDPDIEQLDLSESEITNLVEFLKALTDPRVACHRAPFDHPELKITDGHFETLPLKTRLRDRKLKLIAVGAAGVKKAWCDPNTGDLFARNLLGGLLRPVN